MGAKCCKEYYLIDVIVDGNNIRKRKYRKEMTMITSKWYDYNNVEVTDPGELARINSLALPENKVDCSYDDHAVFMESTNIVSSLSGIPMDKHVVVVDWIPEGEQNVISMKYPKGIDGDSYYIIITNKSNQTSSLYVPTEEEPEEGRTASGNIVNIGGTYLSMVPGATERARATYRDGKWYWEIYPKPSSAPEGSIPLGDVDYLVFRYLWESTSGRDLDTATELVNSNIPNVDGNGVGYNCSGNSIADVTAILKWGGDNTGSGKECVWVSIKELREKFVDILPDETFFMAYATWFGEKGDGKCAFELKAYKGGTMSQDGYNFINTGGETVFQNVYDFVCDTYKGSPDYRNNYTNITKVVYDKLSNSVYMIIGGENIGQDDRYKDIYNRLNSLDSKVANVESEVEQALCVTLDHKPIEDDLSYTNTQGRFNFKIGAFVKYKDASNNVVSFYKLSAISEGKADWVLLYQESYGVVKPEGIYEGNKSIVEVLSKVNIKGIVSDLDEVTIVNSFSEPIDILFDNISEGEYSHLANSFGISSLSLKSGNSISFYKKVGTYSLFSFFGVSLLPEFVDLEREGDWFLKVMPNGFLAIEKKEPITVFDDSITEELTLASLNEKYPNAKKGFSLVCSSIGRRYECIDAGVWCSYNLILVV